MFYLGGRRCTILSTTEEAIMYMHESDGGKVESITVQRDQWADHVKQQENKCQKSSDS